MIDEKDLLGINSTVIAGTLIFLTLVSSLGLGIVTPSYLAATIIFPFAYSAMVLLTIKPGDKSDEITHKIMRAKRYTRLGFLTLMVIISIIAIYAAVSSFMSVSEKCAKDPKRYNVTHPYDCAKFTSGSLLEQCAQDPKRYNLNKTSDCSKFISPT
jgi:hypothetical protein